MGSPDEVVDDLDLKIWKYGQSTVTMKAGKVYSWRNSGELKASCGLAANRGQQLNIGSTVSDVVAAYGTPITIRRYDSSGEMLWEFADWLVTIRAGKVAQLQARGRPPPRPVPVHLPVAPPVRSAPVAVQSPSAPVQPSRGGTAIRVRNESKVDFKNVVVGGKKYGDIKQGATTDYQTWDRAYKYAYVSLFVESKQFKIQPYDYVGETPLGEGHFTYVLALGDGSLDIWTEKDKE